MDITPLIFYWPDGSKRLEQWLFNGELHRLNGPAFIKYYKSGNIQYESWHVNRKHHRADGPGYIEYYRSGQIALEHWYLNGKQLNDNVIEYKEWLVDNNLYDKSYNNWTDEEKVLWKLRW